MAKKEHSLQVHFALLTLVAAAIIGIWMLPILLAGFPPELSYLVRDAKTLSLTGVLPDSSAQLTTVVLSLLHPFVAWDAMAGWSVVNAVLFGLGFYPLWWAVSRHTDRTTAWVTVVLYALMPMYWYKAVRIDGYALALTLLFSAYATYLYFAGSRPRTGLWLAGFLFGLCLAAKSAFITFLPFLALAYVWHHRTTWLRAGVSMFVFCAVAYVGSVTPALFQTGLPMGERIVQMLPSAEEKTPGTGHLYPDDYTYEFLKEEFDAYTENRIDEASFLERQEDLHYRLIFNVGDRSLSDHLLSSFWLLFTALPPLVLQETVGGAFVWLFILPGAVFLYRKDKQFVLWLLGIWVSMEFLLRFVLLFGRDHLMDVGWILALFGGVGIAAFSADAGKRLNISARTVCIVTTVIIALQFAQSSRKYFTHLYERSTVPETYAAQVTLDTVPETAVVAHPRMYDVFFFSDVQNVSIHSPTVAFLAERGRLREPFVHYGVTHLFGYSDDQLRIIRSAVPGLAVVTPGQPQHIEMTPGLKFLLHLIR